MVREVSASQGGQSEGAAFGRCSGRRMQRVRGEALSAAWRDLAACRGRADLFVVDDPSAAAVSEMKSICAVCPVRAACRKHSVKAREPWGVWGGMTERERKKLAGRRSA